MSHRHFILTHKGDFTFPLDWDENPDDFTIISEKPVTCTFSWTKRQGKKPIRVKKRATVVENVNHWSMGEIPAWQYIFSQLKDGDYATLHHYRRKLEDTGHGVIGHAQYINFGKASVIQQTAYYHSNTMVNLLKKHLPKEYFDHLCRTTLFAPYNLFYADKKTIGEWINFQNYYIGKMIADTGRDIDYWLRIDYGEHGGDTYTQRPGKNISTEYQRRFYAFISERLSTIFWCLKETEYLQKNTQRVLQCQQNQTPYPVKEQFNDMVINYRVTLLEENQRI